MASDSGAACSPEMKKRKKSHSPPVVPPDDLEKVCKLGEGGFGVVYRMKCKSKGYDVAVKRFNPDLDDLKEYETELGVLSRLSHPNIVKLIGIVERSSEDEAFTLMLELCIGGSLKTYLRGSKEKLPPDQFTSWATQAAKAIEYLHNEGIIHKDVKSDNYLITDDNVLKLADFGLSKAADRTVSSVSDEGTAAYMAPEIHKGALSPKSDLFAYGVVLWELLTRGVPFEGLLDRNAIIWQITKKGLRPKIPKDCPEDLDTLITRCWDEDRNKRPTIEEVLSVVKMQRDTLIDTTRSREETIDKTPTEELQLRGFQLELAKPALPGDNGQKNTIIVAPTGCGKTIVAVKVAKEFLESAGGSPSEGESFSGVPERPKKVVFLVDKVLLVDQQCNVFRRFFGASSVIGLSGETAQRPLSGMLEDKDILVMTAQILMNAIEDKDKDVTLSQIGLLILDECHNCQGGSPYNSIMGVYRAMKISGEQPRPQILGMTASLSIGQSRHDSRAEENTLILCANLDAEAISTVHSPECLEELERYQNEPHEEIVEAPGRSRDPFADEIKDIMEEIQSSMTSDPDWNALVENNPTMKIPKSLGNNSYIQWIQKSKTDVAVIINDRTVKRKLMTCLNHLEKYNKCLDINSNIRSKDALTYLEHFRKDLEVRRQGFDDTDRYLVRLFDEKKARLQQIADDPANNNPVLMKLGAVLKKAFNPLAGGSVRRGIVFAKTRAFAAALKSWIEETDDLKFLKPGFLTGTGKTSFSEIQMTQSQQVDLLSKFRQGDHKLIVATSIAQEGLDVAACNVVIRYNHTTNVVGRIQTKGRNRAKDGVYYLVVDESLKLRDSDMMIRIGEKSMMKATKKIQKELNENREHMFEQIMQMQKKDHRLRDQKQKSDQSKLQSRVQDRVKVSCLKCSEFAFYSNDLRLIKGAHHVVVDESFTSRFETKPMKKCVPLKDDFTIQEVLVCAKCKRDWGHLARYEGKDLPLVHPKGLLFENAQGKRKTFKKWAEAWFKIEKYDM